MAICTDRLIDRLTYWLIDAWIDWWLIDWLLIKFERSIEWLIDWWVDRLFGGLMHIVDRWVDGLIDWWPNDGWEWYRWRHQCLIIEAHSKKHQKSVFIHRWQSKGVRDQKYFVYRKMLYPVFQSFNTWYHNNRLLCAEINTLINQSIHLSISQSMNQTKFT